MPLCKQFVGWWTVVPVEYLSLLVFLGISASLLLQQFILRRRGKFIPIFVRIPLHTNIFGCSNKQSDECHTLQCITASRMMNGIEL